MEPAMILQKRQSVIGENVIKPCAGSCSEPCGVTKLEQSLCSRRGGSWVPGLEHGIHLLRAHSLIGEGKGSVLFHLARCAKKGPQGGPGERAAHADALYPEL